MAVGPGVSLAPFFFRRFLCPGRGGHMGWPYGVSIWAPHGLHIWQGNNRGSYMGHAWGISMMACIDVRQQ